MKTAIDIIQNVFLHQIQKDLKFDILKTNAGFWEKFANDLLHFEEDAKPIYASIYSLELTDAEKIIDKLSDVYSKFLNELAENYVLGQTSDATNYLVKTNNKAFFKEVRFLQTMQQAIKSVERKRIKADLPNSYKRLTFEISDADIDNATKKKGREDLKEKMKGWDSELVDEELTTVISIANGQKNKIISLSWAKYTVAACVVLATGVFFFKNTNQVSITPEHTIVTNDKKKDTLNPKKSLPLEKAVVIESVTTVSENTIVQQLDGLGFSDIKKLSIKIIFKDATSRIASIKKHIAMQTSDNAKATIENHKKELAVLEKVIDNYIFDKKSITLFSSFNFKHDAILVTDDQNYYLKKGNFYYDLKPANKTLQLTKVSDIKILSILKKISFENTK